MSINNAIVGADRIVVVADTEIVSMYETDGSITSKPVRGNCSKLLTMPHWPGLIAFRGVNPVPHSLAAQLAGVGTYDEADRVFERLAEGLVGIIAAGPLAAAAQAECAVFLAGWSPRGQRLAAALWLRPAGPVGQAWTRHEYGPGSALASPPPMADMEAVPRPETTAEQLELARQQVARLRAEAPDSAGGGDLVIASLTACRIELEIVRDFVTENRARAAPAAMIA